MLISSSFFLYVQAVFCPLGVFDWVGESVVIHYCIDPNSNILNCWFYSIQNRDYELFFFLNFKLPHLDYKFRFLSQSRNKGSAAVRMLYYIFMYPYLSEEYHALVNLLLSIFFMVWLILHAIENALYIYMFMQGIKPYENVGPTNTQIQAHTEKKNN